MQWIVIKSVKFVNTIEGNKEVVGGAAFLLLAFV